MLLDDTGGEGGMRKEGRHVKIVVSLDEDSNWTEVSPLISKDVFSFTPAGAFQATFSGFILKVPAKLPVHYYCYSSLLLFII